MFLVLFVNHNNNFFTTEFTGSARNDAATRKRTLCSVLSNPMVDVPPGGKRCGIPINNVGV